LFCNDRHCHRSLKLQTLAIWKARWNLLLNPKWVDHCMHGTLTLYKVSIQMQCTAEITHNTRWFNLLSADWKAFVRMMDDLAIHYTIISSLITNSMEQSPWECNSYTACQKFPTLYRTWGSITVFSRAHCWSLTETDDSSQQPPTLFF
jgi:hypothetical protein